MIQEDMLLVLRGIVQYLLLVVVLTTYLYTYKPIHNDITEIVSILLRRLYNIYYLLLYRQYNIILTYGTILRCCTNKRNIDIENR